MERIDAHSHFGKTYLGPENRPDRYLLEAEKLNLVCSVISPAPCPEYLVGKDIFRPCIWKFEKGKVNYVQQYYNPKEEAIFSETHAGQNPYHYANWQLVAQTSQINQGCRQEIKVMPIHHPFLDTENELLSLMEENCVVAIKFHGFATFAGPESIKPTLITELKARRMPIVVHTDMFNGLSLGPAEIARELNNPVEWVKWAIETEVPTLITHGARLSEKAINLARGHKHILIGCSPDLAIMGEKDFALGKVTVNFLNSLLAIVPSGQLVFDIDYGWNVRKIGDWEDQDWDMLQRLERSATKLGLSEKDLENICYKNAISFFRL